MATRVSITVIRLPTEERMLVNASSAPSTSLFNRLTRAPVYLQVKTIRHALHVGEHVERMSKISPWPMVEER